MFKWQDVLLPLALVVFYFFGSALQTNLLPHKLLQGLSVSFHAHTQSRAFGLDVRARPMQRLARLGEVQNFAVCAGVRRVAGAAGEAGGEAPGARGQPTQVSKCFFAVWSTRHLCARIRAEVTTVGEIISMDCLWYLS